MKTFNLSISAKFYLIAALYIFPIISLFYAFMRFSEYNLNFMENELRDSIILQKSAEIKDFIFQSTFADTFKTNPELNKLISDNHDVKIVQIFDLLHKEYPEVFTQKDSQPSLEKLFSRWKVYENSKKEEKDKYDFISSTSSEADFILNSLPENSKLILDFDLNTYTLIDLTLMNLQKIFNAIKFEKKLEDTKISKESILDIKRELAEITKKIKKYESMENRLFSDDEVLLKRKVLELSQKFLAETNTFLEKDMSPEEQDMKFVANLLTTYQKSLALYMELHNLIQLHLRIRVTEIWRERFVSLAASSTLWLIALIFSFILQKSILRSVNLITKRLHSVLRDTRQMSEQLTQSAAEVSDSAATEAAAVQQSVAALSQMNSMLAQTAKDTETTRNVVEEASITSQEGIEQINQLGKTMTDITHATNQLMDINKIINEISQKTQVINDIVFKSQLLAVNAAIEAAKAGHQGKGFSVVANEVSNLASISGKAATEIGDLIHNSSKQVNSIVHKSSESIKLGQDQTGKSISCFQKIAHSVSLIKEKTNQISNASKEQTAAIEQTSIAMASLNKNAQNSQYLSQKCLIQSKKLEENANKLNNVEEALTYAFFGKEPQIVHNTLDQSFHNDKDPPPNLSDSKPEDLSDLSSRITAKATKMLNSSSKEQNGSTPASKEAA